MILLHKSPATSVPRSGGMGSAFVLISLCPKRYCHGSPQAFCSRISHNLFVLKNICEISERFNHSRICEKKISANSARDSQHHTPTLRTIIIEKGRCAACKHISLLLFRVYYLFLMIRCFPNPWFESTYIPCRDIC